MAQTPCHDHEDTIGLAESGKLHQGDQHRRDNSPADRSDKRKAEPERIKHLYAEIRNGHEVAKQLGIGSATVKVTDRVKSVLRHHLYPPL